MSSGALLASAQREQLIRELDVTRRQGLNAVMRLLSSVEPSRIDDSWPIIGPIIAALIDAQQQAGRNATMAYITGIGAATGIVGASAMAPSAALVRDGMLPSGLPMRRLVAAVPSALAHRIENGLTAPEAWKITSGHVVSAAADAVHDESRKTAADVLRNEDVEWQRAQSQAQNELFYKRPQFTRYIRVPSPNACPFCLMLATKGPVYYKDSWSGANRKFRGNGDARAHAHCQCVLLPEPRPGAYKNTVFGDAEQYANSVWRDTKYKRDYELKSLLKQAVVLPSSPGRYGPAA